MSNQPSARNYQIAEALDYRSPVSESLMKNIGGTVNWLLDKDTTNDSTLSGITSDISSINTTLNTTAVNFLIDYPRTTVVTNPAGTSITTAAREFIIFGYNAGITIGALSSTDGYIPWTGGGVLFGTGITMNFSAPGGSGTLWYTRFKYPTAL